MALGEDGSSRNSFRNVFSMPTMDRALSSSHSTLKNLVVLIGKIKYRPGHTVKHCFSRVVCEPPTSESRGLLM